MSKPLDVRARELSEKALNTLAEIMNDPFEEAKDRIRASTEILDRGHGKAAQAVIAVPAMKQARIRAATYSDADLDRIIDAEFEVLERQALPAPRKDPLLE